MTELAVRKYKGCLALTGCRINAVATTWIQKLESSIDKAIPIRCLKQREARDKDPDSENFHMNLISAEEMSRLQATANIDQVIDQMDQALEVFGVGVSHYQKDDLEIWYALIHCPWGDELRRRLGFAEKDFHISLAFNHVNITPNRPKVPKSFQTITDWVDLPELLDIVTSQLCRRKYDGDSLSVTSTSSAAATTISTASTTLGAVLDAVGRDVIGEGCNEKTEVLVTRLARDLIEVNPLFLKTHLKQVTLFGQWLAKSKHTDLASKLGFHMLDCGLLLGLRLIKMVFAPKPTDSLEIMLLNAILPLKLMTLDFESEDEVWFEKKEERKLLMKVNKRVFQSWVRDTFPRYVLAVDASTQTLNQFPLPYNFQFVTVPLHPSLFLGPSSTRAPSYSEVSCMASQLLCGSAQPTTCDQIIALSGLGVRCILTIHEEALSETVHACAATQSMDIHHFSVLENKPPSLGKLRRICSVIHEFVCMKGEGPYSRIDSHS